MFKLNGIILKQICPNLFADRAASLAALINEIAPKYGVDTADELHEFIAQVAHESIEFSAKTESLNYSLASRIVTTWPTRFNLDGTGGKLNANNYVRNSEKLANTVYANRMGNGDFNSGDGFRYRGAGFMQITGKDMFAAYAKHINKPIVETAELVRTTDRFAMDSAFWVFSVVKGLNDEAERDEFLTITKRINGGTNGLADREKYYTRAKKYIL